MPKSKRRKPRLSKRANQLLNSKATYVINTRGRFVKKSKGLLPGYRIYSRSTGKLLLAVRIPAGVESGGVRNARNYYRKFSGISRGRPSSKYFHPKYKVFTNRKREPGKERFITASVFALVMAAMNVKTSDAAKVKSKQVWIRRILLDTPHGIKWWADALKKPHFLWLEVKEQVESQNADFISIIGFEGVR